MSLIRPCAANIAQRKLPAASAFLPDVTENPRPVQTGSPVDLILAEKCYGKAGVREAGRGVCGHASRTQFENLTSGAPDREKGKPVSLSTIVSNRFIKDNPPTLSPFII